MKSDKRSTQADRFTYIRERLGLSKQDFAASLGIHPSVASVIESGDREASKDVLSRLALVHKVNLNWYLTGNGDSRIPEPDSRDSVYVPHILHEAAAGRGVEIDDYAETRMIAVPRSLLARSNPATLRAVTVRGDSMTEKEIYDRDIVVYDANDVAGDAICVVSVSGQLLVKYVSVEAANRRITLLSANKLYPPRIVEGPDMEAVKIEGRVVACLHGLR